MPRLTINYWQGLIVLLCVVGFLSCNKKEVRDAPPSVYAEKPIKQLFDSKNAVASFDGVIRFEGSLPSKKQLYIGDASCRQQHKDIVYMDQVLVRDGKLQNVFVYIKKGLEAYKFPPNNKPKAMDQKACLFDPLLIGIEVGQPIIFLNSDAILHNVHTSPKINDGVNIAITPFNRSQRVFEQPEVMVSIKCDVHPWMRGYIGVVEHPYYAVTSVDGSFSLGPLPPGDYVLEAWHETLGRKTQTVTLKKGKMPVTIVFTR